MTQTASRNPHVAAPLELTERVLSAPVGRLASGFHVHSVDDTLGEIYTESVRADSRSPARLAELRRAFSRACRPSP